MRGNDSGKEKRQNTENCGWSAILNASGVWMANIDIITPVFFSSHFRRFLHRSPDHQWNAIYSPPDPSPPIHGHYKQEKGNLINKKSATQTQRSPTEVRLGRFSAAGWEVVLSFSPRWRRFAFPRQRSDRMSNFPMFPPAWLNKVMASMPHPPATLKNKIFPKINFQMHNKHRSNSNRGNSSIHELYLFLKLIFKV